MAKARTSQGGEPAATGDERTIVIQHQAPAPVQVSDQERDEFVTHLIGQHGSPSAALSRLATEQIKFRKRAQRAEREAAELRVKLPAADAVVLVGEEATAYKDIKSKNIVLAKVPGMVAELSTLQTTVATQSREKALADAAGKKYDVKVLQRLLGDTVVEFQSVNQMKEDKSGIETIQVPFVVLGTGETKTREALDSYVEREFAPFKPILYKGEDGGSGTESGGNNDGPRMPQQSSAPIGGGAKGGKNDILKVVDSQLSGFMTPSQRRKENAGSATE